MAENSSQIHDLLSAGPQNHELLTTSRDQSHISHNSYKSIRLKNNFLMDRLVLKANNQFKNNHGDIGKIRNRTSADRNLLTVNQQEQHTSHNLLGSQFDSYNQQKLARQRQVYDYGTDNENTSKRYQVKNEYMTEDEDAVQNSARRSKKKIFEKDIQINLESSADFEENGGIQNEQTSKNLKLNSQLLSSQDNMDRMKSPWLALKPQPSLGGPRHVNMPYRPRIRQRSYSNFHVLSQKQGYIGGGPQSQISAQVESIQQNVQTFNLNDAFIEIGGFGRFQWLSLVLLTLVRNFGLHQQLGFAIMIAQQEFECLFTKESVSLFQEGHPATWLSCPVEEICAYRSDPGVNSTNFMYKVDKTYVNYVNNWFITLDMMCIPTSTKDYFCSIYFVGFAVGIIFFTVPDAIGRKRTMWVLLPPYILASSLSVYGSTIQQKMVGFFIQGFLHNKIMLSYSHCFELVPINYKKFCSTFINTLDILTFTVIPSYLMFVSRDAVEYLKLVNTFGIVATILYLALIPESPRWLFQNGRDEEGIEVMNYIASVNGSEKRIPPNAQFDLLEEVIQQNNGLEKTKAGDLMAIEKQSVYSMFNQFQIQNRLAIAESIQSQKINAVDEQSNQLAEALLQSQQDIDDLNNDNGVMANIKELLCGESNSRTFYMGLLIFIATFNVLYMQIFIVKNSENILMNYLMFGVAIMMGVCCSPLLLSLMKDIHVYIFAFVLILVANIVMDSNRGKISEIMVGCLTSLQAFGEGVIMNTQMVIVAQRMDMKLLQTTISLLFCLANLVASTAPKFADAEAPIPFITMSTYCIIGITAAFNMSLNDDREEFAQTLEEDLEQQTYSMMYGADNLQDGQNYQMSNYDTTSQAQLTEYSLPKQVIFNNLLAGGWFGNGNERSIQSRGPLADSDYLSSDWDRSDNGPNSYQRI